MFQAARKHLKAIATLGVAAALVVGGVAAAQGGSGTEGQGTSGQKGMSHRPPGPPPMTGPGGKNLTYAELHVLNKEGNGEVVRIDNGKVKSTGDNSITLTENDGSEVTIKVDDNTEVLGKPGTETTLADLAGQQVSVTATEGEAAKAIMVMPKKGGLPSGFHGGPPPGALPMDGSSPGTLPKEGSSE